MLGGGVVVVVVVGGIVFEGGVISSLLLLLVVGCVCDCEEEEGEELCCWDPTKCGGGAGGQRLRKTVSESSNDSVDCTSGLELFPLPVSAVAVAVAAPEAVVTSEPLFESDEEDIVPLPAADGRNGNDAMPDLEAMTRGPLFRFQQRPRVRKSKRSCVRGFI